MEIDYLIESLSSVVVPERYLERLICSGENGNHFENFLSWRISFIMAPGIMAPGSDQRKVPGTVVHIKARAVTSEAYCKRLYGSLWKAKLVPGIVVSLVHGTPGTREQCSIIGDWEVGTGVKRAKTKLGNVKLGDVPQEPELPVAEEIVSNEVTPSPQLIQISGTPSNCNPLPFQVSDGDNQSGPASAPDEAMNTSVHGFNWMPAEVNTPLNGHVLDRAWKVRGEVDTAVEGQFCDSLDPYASFLWMFPHSMLLLIVEETNIVLEEEGLKFTSVGEILKFFGVLVLMTRFEFGSRHTLWHTKGANKYIPGANFGKFISRNRFDQLRTCIRFCRASNVTASEDRWAPVLDFFNAINNHRKSRVVPSETICVDESMSRWYGLGGSWISKGLPHYVALDRKPESGCELKTAACGKSGILIRIEIVRASDDSEAEGSLGISHGSANCKRLVSPWFYSGQSGLCRFIFFVRGNRRGALCCRINVYWSCEDCQ